MSESSGLSQFRADVARGLLAEMEASQEFVKGKGAFANADERETVLRVYREASAALHREMEARSAAVGSGSK